MDLTPELTLPAPQWTKSTDEDWRGDFHTSYSLQINHGLKDEKGRLVGGFATIAQLPPDFASTYTEGGTKLFRLIINATRNDQIYGSGRSFSFHATLALAQKQAQRKFAEQLQSYTKKYAS